MTSVTPSAPNLPAPLSAAILPLRLVIGLAVFVSEGLQKFLYPDALGAGRFADIGIPFPEVMGPLVGVTEIGCGLALAAGWRTRWVSLPLIGVMGVALLSTKLPILLGSDVWIFNVRELSRYGLLAGLHEARTDLTVLAGLIVLASADADRWSLDARRAR